MKIGIASDHAAFNEKSELIHFLENKGFEVSDFGCNSEDSVDYPDYAHILSRKINNRSDQLGILICGSGTGMVMAANKHKNVRAALCYDVKSTRLSRLHNNANVMTIGSRLTKKKVALKCVNIFLKTNFDGARHLRRIKKI